MRRPSEVVYNVDNMIVTARRLHAGIQSMVALTLGLLAFGWYLAPRVMPLMPAAVFLAYALFARITLTRPALGARVPVIACATGIMASAVFVPALWIEYAGRTANNGWLFGSIVALWAVAGWLAASQSGRVGDAIVASTLSAMITSVAVVIAVLAPYYLLRGTPLQDVFFRTEGTYDDFARSGVADFNTWVIEDMFGGAFMHSAFGAVVGAVLGAMTGGVTVLLRRG